jgi:hypothetical protein
MVKAVSTSPPVTIEELDRRLNDLQTRLENSGAVASSSQTWWRDQAGRFENDPIFAEIVRLGRQQRQALRTSKKKKRARS